MWVLHAWISVCVCAARILTPTPDPLGWQAYDQHLNMILGGVEETITVVEYDEDTFEEHVKVGSLSLCDLCLNVSNQHFCLAASKENSRDAVCSRGWCHPRVPPPAHELSWEHGSTDELKVFRSDTSTKR